MLSRIPERAKGKRVHDALSAISVGPIYRINYVALQRFSLRRERFADPTGYQLDEPMFSP